MAWVHFRIIIGLDGTVKISDDPARGFMKPKDFVNSFDGAFYSDDQSAWVALDKRHDGLYIDFGEPAA